MNQKATLGDLVAANPGAAQVFHRYRLDFCCGGLRTLDEACRAQGLDPSAVLAEIKTEQPPAAEKTVRWDEEPLESVVSHIVKDYHQPLRKELPRLIALARQVERVHAGKPGCPRGLAEQLEQMRESILSHLDKEERNLFPLVTSGQKDWTYSTVGILFREHTDVGEDLRRIRELTRDLRLPADACTTWRELYRSLEAFEAETMQHVHLENNILFPRMVVGDKAWP